MIPRLATVFIFLFCGTMTTLLVRSVLYPLGTGLAEVPPQVAFDLFAVRKEGSVLDIWQGKTIIGRAEVTPNGPVNRPQHGQAEVAVRINVVIRPPQTLLGSEYIKLQAAVRLHANGELDDLELNLSLPGSLPPLNLAVRHPAGQAAPSLNLTRGETVLFSAESGKAPEGLMAIMIDNLLRSAGIPLDTLQAKAADSGEHGSVRAGWFDAGDTRHDGYIFSNGGDSTTRFILFMTNTGEMVRLDTPLTGDNELGLRLLAESLRPASAVVPVLDEFAPFKLRKQP